MAVSTITAKGQTTIPVDIRNQLGLKPGDKVEFFLDENGQAVMKPLRKIHVSELYGVLPKPKRRLSLEEMDQAIARHMVKDYLRSVSDEGN